MKILTAAAAILLVGTSMFVWTSAPCGLWKYASVGETPARCVHADW